MSCRYLATVEFRPARGRLAKAAEQVWSLSGAWRHSGQMCGETFVTEDAARLSLIGAVHERHSLSARCANRDVLDVWSKLAPLLARPPRIALTRLNEGAPPCRCRRLPTVLFAPRPFDATSPLACTGCRRRVPLYRFHRRMKVSNPYGGLLQLEDEWKGAYLMWLNSCETEAAGWRLLADPASPLSRRANRALAEFARAGRVKVYYEQFLYYARSEDGPEATLCPGCGRRWDTSGKIAELACHGCRRFADKPVEFVVPRWWRPPGARTRLTPRRP